VYGTCTMSCTHDNVAKDSDELFERLSDPKEFASVVGACIYISTTCRPDIAHAVGRLSRSMHATEVNIAQVRTLMGYLKLTREYKLTYHRHDHPIKSLLYEYGEKEKNDKLCVEIKLKTNLTQGECDLSTCSIGKPT